MSAQPFTTVVAPPAVPAATDGLLASEVLAHLDVQLISARRLLAIVLEQGAAIRRRDVHEVVACTGLMQAELQRRAVVESERSKLLQRAGVQLGIDPGAVTIDQLAVLMDAESGHAARVASAELRGTLAQVQQEHHTNRALMTRSSPSSTICCGSSTSTIRSPTGRRAVAPSDRPPPWPAATACWTCRSDRLPDQERDSHDDDPHWRRDEHRPVGPGGLPGRHRHDRREHLQRQHRRLLASDRQPR